ncbi:MAG TPA: homocysteine S-methyltransferase family protein [Candidatus Limnocylindrales bacterium]|nr:homocysteine S-methyltransferase family protein [Candidatus Limnocylindrales bacterium]
MIFSEFLAKKRVVLFDGAIGTELARLGLETSGGINLTNPEHIVNFHRRYARLGVDVLTTNTFTLNRISVESHGLTLDLHAANLSGVRLAKEAINEGQFVFGDIGPTGRLLEPYGNYTEQQFFDNFREQALVLAEGGVDGFIIETMTDLREAICALKACRDATELPVIVTLAFSTTAKGGRTVMGSSVSETTAALEAHGADAVGANCGELSPEEMAIIAAMYKEFSTLPVLIQPNAGKPKLVGRSTVYDMKPEEFADGIKKCIDSGASIVGGCCGTTLEHIRAVVQMVRQ